MTVRGFLYRALALVGGTMKRHVATILAIGLLLTSAVGIAAALPSPLVRQDPGEGCWQTDCWGKLVVEGGELKLICVNRSCVPATDCKKWPYSTEISYCQCHDGYNSWCAMGENSEGSGSDAFNCAGACIDTTLRCCKQNIMGGLAQCCKCVVTVPPGGGPGSQCPPP